MINDVACNWKKVNTMDQDVSLGVTMTITQADIPFLRQNGRLGEYAVVYRAYRSQSGGGFGDQEKHPYAWGVLVYVDTQVARIYSARGLPREWSDLTRLEKWMRAQGFWYWWMRNDLEPLLMTSADEENETDLNTNEKELSVSAPETPVENETAPLPTQMFKMVPEPED